MAAREATRRMDEACQALGEAGAALSEWSVESLNRSGSRLEEAARLVAVGIEELRGQVSSGDMREAAALRAAVEKCRSELVLVRTLHDRGAAFYSGWMAWMASLVGAGYTPRGVEGLPVLASAGSRVSLDA